MPLYPGFTLAYILKAVRNIVYSLEKHSHVPCPHILPIAHFYHLLRLPLIPQIHRNSINIIFAIYV